MPLKEAIVPLAGTAKAEATNIPAADVVAVVPVNAALIYKA